MRHVLGCLLLAAASAAGAADHIVTAFSGPFRFEPAELQIAAGDTVTFVNGGGFHNVVSVPAAVQAFRCADGCDGDGQGGSGDASAGDWSATVAFPVPGIAGFYCEIHGSPGAGMFGTITVVAAASPVFEDGFETTE